MSCQYLVTLNCPNDLDFDIENWLLEHIEEMLNIEGFEKATLWKEELEENNNENVIYHADYRLKDRAALQNYFDKFVSNKKYFLKKIKKF